MSIYTPQAPQLRWSPAQKAPNSCYDGIRSPRQSSSLCSTSLSYQWRYLIKTNSQRSYALTRLLTATMAEFQRLASPCTSFTKIVYLRKFYTTTVSLDSQLVAQQRNLRNLRKKEKLRWKNISLSRTQNSPLNRKKQRKTQRQRRVL